MIRIEGGAWRGKSLKVPASDKLRPSSSKTRASIFNILESQRLKLGLERDLSGWRCLDLFAGVGALGIEAMSRGADFCAFVEKSHQHSKALQQNLSFLNAEAQSTLFLKPVEKVWQDLAGLEPFHLVFADPPYEFEEFAGLLRELVALTHSGAWLVLEHDPKRHPEGGEAWELNSTRILGPAGISVFRKLS